MSDPRPLQTIQQWMQAVIAHPGGIESGIASPAARDEINISLNEIEQVIEPSARNGSLDRLRIYGNAYYARLLEVLRESFPITAKTIGEETFDQFSFGYLQQYPSTSYTLNRLGDRFAQYLQETRPDAAERAQGRIGWPDLLVDLVRLEWTIEQVFDGPGMEGSSPLAAEQLAAIRPEQWPDARLVTAPCLRLLAFDYPVNEYFTAMRKMDAVEPPAPAPSWLALSRRDYIVRRIPISREQFLLLSALKRGGTVGEAIATVAEQVEDHDQLAHDLQGWFRDWTAAQLFADIRWEQS